MRFAFAALSGCVAACLIFAGCSLDDGSVQEISGIGTDGGTGAAPDGGVTLVDSGPGKPPGDAGTPDVFVDAGPPPPPAPCSIPPGACVGAIPAGWSIVSYKASQATACADPFVASDVVSNPVPGSGTCACGCTVNQASVCDQGSLSFKTSGGTDGTCGGGGSTFTVAGGACQKFGGGTSLADHTKASAIAATGGTCTPNANANAAAITTTPGRVCAPPANCQEQLCESDAGTGGGYATCIATNGTPGSCPTGWGTAPVVVGNSTALTCTNACTCDANATSTCTGAQLAVYSDQGCTNLVDTLGIDGTCEDNRTHGNGSSLGSFKYSATLTQACGTGGSTTPQVTLNGGQTICCRP